MTFTWDSQTSRTQLSSISSKRSAMKISIVLRKIRSLASVKLLKDGEKDVWKLCAILKFWIFRFQFYSQRYFHVKKNQDTYIDCFDEFLPHYFLFLSETLKTNENTGQNKNIFRFLTRKVYRLYVKYGQGNYSKVCPLALFISRRIAANGCMAVTIFWRNVTIYWI